MPCKAMAHKPSHKYTLFISANGTFKLQWKNKHSDLDDVSLNNSHGYFVANASYCVYLTHVGDCHEVHALLLLFSSVN